MDMLDQALESSSHDKSEDQAIEEHTAHLQDGAVTYRVVQVQGQPAEVTAGDGTAQVVTTSAFAGQQVAAQAVLASPFSNGTAEGNQASADDGHGAEARFAYFPAAAVTASASDHSHAQAIETLSTANSTGQFYVMMSPQDVIQQGTQRSIAPRTHFTVKGAGTGAETGPRTPRDERRRATHNEVERRRRDKINNWIMKLAKIIPECAGDHSKQGQSVSLQSKGGILSKACDYIHELRAASSRVPEIMKENERMAVDLELIRQQCEELKNENTFLRTSLGQHGITIERPPPT